MYYLDRKHALAAIEGMRQRTIAGVTFDCSYCLNEDDENGTGLDLSLNSNLPIYPVHGNATASMKQSNKQSSSTVKQSVANKSKAFEVPTSTASLPPSLQYVSGPGTNVPLSPNIMGTLPTTTSALKNQAPQLDLPTANPVRAPPAVNTINELAASINQMNLVNNQQVNQLSQLGPATAAALGVVPSQQPILSTPGSMQPQQFVTEEEFLTMQNIQQLQQQIQQLQQLQQLQLLQQQQLQQQQLQQPVFQGQSQVSHMSHTNWPASMEQSNLSNNTLAQQFVQNQIQSQFMLPGNHNMIGFGSSGSHQQLFQHHNSSLSQPTITTSFNSRSQDTVDSNDNLTETFEYDVNALLGSRSISFDEQSQQVSRQQQNQTNQGQGKVSVAVKGPSSVPVLYPGLSHLKLDGLNMSGSASSSFHSSATTTLSHSIGSPHPQGRYIYNMNPATPLNRSMYNISRSQGQQGQSYNQNHLYPNNDQK